VQTGLKVLSDIANPLQELTDNAGAQTWLQQLETVRKLAVKNRTVVGVVGNTGAGKSSVINAILDEERLVPTNCMRACTAVVTEMSYNDSNNEASRYRAEVEFIRPEDWRKELKIPFDEVFDDGGGVVREVSNPDSQTGIAYAKIRAVYHKHTKEMLSGSTIDALMRVKNVQNVLGLYEAHQRERIVQLLPSPTVLRGQQGEGHREARQERQQDYYSEARV